MIRPKVRIAMILPLLAVVAACGKVGDLQPRSATSTPPIAYGATESESPEALTTPSIQARPGAVTNCSAGQRGAMPTHLTFRRARTQQQSR